MDLYAVDGAIPPELLEEFVEYLRRNPWHPGRHIATTCERKSLSIPEAAKQLGIERAPCKGTALQRVRIPPGNCRSSRKAIGAVDGGNDMD